MPRAPDVVKGLPARPWCLTRLRRAPRGAGGGRRPREDDAVSVFCIDEGLDGAAQARESANPLSRSHDRLRI